MSTGDVKTIRLYQHDGISFIDEKFVENADGTYSQFVALSENHIGEVGGNLITKIVEITRQDNATPYAVGDVVSSLVNSPIIYELPNILRVNGGSGYLADVRIAINVKSITPVFRIHFFNDSNVSVAGDNLPHKELYADVSKRLGFIDLGAMVTAADTANSDMSRGTLLGSPYLPLFGSSNSRSIWFSLETLSVVTLTASCKISVIVSVDNN